jgi:hypothetical protein
MKAKRALNGLGPKIDVARMRDEHIKVVAPILLGDHIYEQFASVFFSSWAAFEIAVEARYGLSRKQILDAFYAMRPEADEREAEFLLRVEDFRVKYQ